MGANAQTSVPTFTAGQVLTAAQQNQSARTGVPVFEDATARDAAFGGTGEKTLAEGQLAYLEDSNVVQYYDGAAWATVGPTTSAVVQVKSTSKTDTFTTTSTSLVDVTGLSVTITPTSASNKVLAFGYVMIGSNTNSHVGSYMTLIRDSTAIGIGDAAGSRSRITSDMTTNASDNLQGSVAFSFLDTPNTTSATTYKVQIRGQAGGTIAVNRSLADTDSTTFSRSASSITVFEVTP
jgi:hypothetical protein